MKINLLALIVPAVVVIISSYAQAQSTDVENKIRETQQKIDLQIEKIRQVREQSDSQMSLAKLQISEQLKRSQDSLALQMETLDQYKNQLAEQKTSTEAAISEIRSNWMDVIDKAASDVETGIRDANSLLTKIQTISDDMSGNGTKANDTATCDGNGCNGQSTTEGNTQTSDTTNTTPTIKTVG